MRMKFFVGATLGLIIGFNISLAALERKKPPPLEFLKNKADPFYTPIPKSMISTESYPFRFLGYKSS